MKTANAPIFITSPTSSPSWPSSQAPSSGTSTPSTPSTPLLISGIPTEEYLQQLRAFNISQLAAMDPNSSQGRGSNASGSSGSSNHPSSGTVYDALLPRIETRGQSYKGSSSNPGEKKGSGRS